MTIEIKLLIENSQWTDPSYSNSELIRSFTLLLKTINKTEQKSFYSIKNGRQK